jgi:ankyrin repeat protein
MKKMDVVLALLLGALLLEGALGRAGERFLGRPWGRQVAALLAGMPQDAPPTAEGRFLEAISAGREAEARRMLDADPRLAFAKDRRDISALMLAIYGGRTPLVDAFLAIRQNKLSVFEAAALGKDDVLQTLLRQEPGLAREFGPDGFTALHLASYFGHPSSQEVLIRAGADVNAYSRNRFHAAPLQSAAAARQLEAARVLLARRANPDCVGEGGYTPLHEAAATGQVELVRLLLQHKADLAARGDDGKTSLDLAIQEKQSAVAELLKGGTGR